MVSPSPGHERDHEEMSSPQQKREAWWKIHLFRGMVSDIRRRIPYYVSDWTDAWDYRVVPATVYMYFAKSVSLSCLLAFVAY
jgi:boron transporter